MTVLIAENDNKGRPSGFAYGIDFEFDGEIAIRLEPNCFPDGEPIQVNRNSGSITICGATIKFKYAPKEWVGNMSWNSYEVPDGYALGLLNILKQSKKWTWTEAQTTLAERWNDADFAFDDFYDMEECVPIYLDSNQKEIEFKSKFDLDAKCAAAVERINQFVDDLVELYYTEEKINETLELFKETGMLLAETGGDKFDGTILKWNFPMMPKSVFDRLVKSPPDFMSKEYVMPILTKSPELQPIDRVNLLINKWGREFKNPM